MLRKQWFKHGDDPFVIKNKDGTGSLPTPMGCITIRPGDWIVTDDSGHKFIETNPAILADLTPFVAKALNYFHEKSEEYGGPVSGGKQP